MEGLVTQMMPVRVALQLKTHQAQQQHQHPQQQLLTEHTGGSADDPPAVQLSAAVAGPSRFAARRAATTAAAAAAADQQSTEVGPLQHPSSQQQQQQPRLESVRSLAMSFKQPQLEMAYRTSTSKQWQQSLDILFVLLSVFSVAGPLLLQARLTGNAVIDGSLAVLLFLAVVVGSQRVTAMPVARYLTLRQPCIAALRLLQALFFCYQSWHLPAQVFIRVQTTQDSVYNIMTYLSAAEKAGCGVLLMQGFMGQLPFVLHAAVQLVCAVMVLGELRGNPARDLDVRAAGDGVAVLCLQAFLGWVLPVAAVGFVEWRSRVMFLHKIK